MRRDIALLAAYVRAALLLQMRNRAEFALDLATSALWGGMAVVPLWGLFGGRGGGRAIAGWSLDQSLLVMGFFLIVFGLSEAALGSVLDATMECLWYDRLDFVLLRPAESRLILSLSRLRPAGLAQSAIGVLAVLSAASRLRSAGGLDLVCAGLLLVAGLIVWHSVYVLAASAMLCFGPVASLPYSLAMLLTFGRFPATIFRGMKGVVFTFVVPLAIMTTYPASAVLGQWDVGMLVRGGGVCCAFYFVSRVVWRHALSRYLRGLV